MKIISEANSRSSSPATSYITTSTSASAAVSTSKRSRSQREPLETIPKRKKKDQGDDTLIAAITRSIEARKSSIIKAIEILAEEYYERLSKSDFGYAIDVLSNEIKASVFITLLIKDIRDKWLERHTRVLLLV